VIDGEGVPGLALGESVDVGIFLEEASKCNEMNFDWDLGRKKEAKFRRFPRWALNSRNKKKGLEPLDSYVKNSCIVKLARLGAGDGTKFSRLVQCMIKSDRDSFCGFLRVEDSNLRPLCLMVTDRGLLGFCVDHPLTQEEEKNVSSGSVSPTLYSWWENKLEENYRIGREQIDQDVMTKEGDKLPENNEHTEEVEYCENAKPSCSSDKELLDEFKNIEQIEKQDTSIEAKNDGKETEMHVEKVLDASEEKVLGASGNSSSTKSFPDIVTTSGKPVVNEESSLTSLRDVSCTVNKLAETMEDPIKIRELSVSASSTSQSTTCNNNFMESDKKNLPATTDLNAKHDWKLFLKTSVKIERLSCAEIRSFIENDRDNRPSTDICGKLQHCTENSNQEKNCLNNNVSWTETACSGEHLKLKRIGAYISSYEINNFIIKFECKICGQFFRGWQERHEHYLEVHGEENLK